MRHCSITIGSGRSLVELRADLTDRGICILLTGGESPHVGAVAVCEPPNMKVESNSNETLWLIPISGHKDIEVAKPLAEMVSRQTGQITVVTAGIHIEQALPEEIQLLQQNCRRAGEKLCSQLKHNVE